MRDVDIHFYKLFRRDDENNVSVNDVTDYLAFRYNISRDIINNTVKWHDLEDKGTLTLQQYLELMEIMRKNIFINKDLNNFNAFDLRHQGFIDALDLYNTLNNMGVPTLYDTALEMIRKADKNNDNKINRDEFKNLFK